MPSHPAYPNQPTLEYFASRLPHGLSPAMHGPLVEALLAAWQAGYRVGQLESEANAYLRPARPGSLT